MTPLEPNIQSKLAGEASTNTARKYDIRQVNMIKSQCYRNQKIKIQLWTYQTTEGHGSL